MKTKISQDQCDHENIKWNTKPNIREYLEYRGKCLDCGIKVLEYFQLDDPHYLYGKDAE